jgi:hypothetical protein
MRRISCALLISSALALTSAAGAQAPSSNEAAAEALFNEARTLIASGRVEEGCKKLEASQSLDPGTGTILHLADCYEKIGRTASAWARFREAASRAARDGRNDWETIAKTRSAELEPKLAKLRIDAPPGVSVSRDGDAIPPAALGSLLPIDPGEHTLTATAPGKKPWSTTIRTVASAVATIAVPALEDDPSSGVAAAPSPAPGPAPSSDGGSTLRTVGYATGAAGIVGLAVGVVSGLAAISKNSRSKDVCPTSGICADESARSDNEDARSAATVSTIGFVAGGVLLAGGIALVLFAPSSSSAPASPSASSSASTSLSAKLHASPQAIWLQGTW